jgi:hypothetical protein
VSRDDPRAASTSLLPVPPLDSNPDWTDFESVFSPLFDRQLLLPNTSHLQRW